VLGHVDEDFAANFVFGFDDEAFFCDDEGTTLVIKNRLSMLVSLVGLLLLHLLHLA
jgi:hypothetical protein